MNAFYAPSPWDSTIVLTEGEVEHARVLRVRVGEKVLALNGRGKTATCEIADVSRKVARLKILEESYTPPPKSRAIMAIALSKAARRGFFLEKTAELGAWEVWIWQARASQGKIDENIIRAAEGKIISGAKQSHNPWFPVPRLFKDAAAVANAAQNAAWRVLPWEKREGVPYVTQAQMRRDGDTVFVIGPEAGFLDEETEIFFAAGFEPVSFGDRPLRCETAATLCLGLHWWASQAPERRDSKPPLAP